MNDLIALLIAKALAADTCCDDPGCCTAGCTGCKK